MPCACKQSLLVCDIACVMCKYFNPSTLLHAQIHIPCHHPPLTQDGVVCLFRQQSVFLLHDCHEMLVRSGRGHITNIHTAHVLHMVLLYHHPLIHLLSQHTQRNMHKITLTSPVEVTTPDPQPGGRKQGKTTKYVLGGAVYTQGVLCTCGGCCVYTGGAVHIQGVLFAHIQIHTRETDM